MEHLSGLNGNLDRERWEKEVVPQLLRTPEGRAELYRIVGHFGFRIRCKEFSECWREEGRDDIEQLNALCKEAQLTLQKMRKRRVRMTLALLVLMVVFTVTVFSLWETFFRALLF